jgi:hypothetical protein
MSSWPLLSTLLLCISVKLRSPAASAGYVVRNRRGIIQRHCSSNYGRPWSLAKWLLTLNPELNRIQGSVTFVTVLSITLVGGSLISSRR